MGCYDTVLVPCPQCGERSEFQSKGGECLMRTIMLEECPLEVLTDVNRHAPNTCAKCGTSFSVKARFVTEAVRLVPEAIRHGD